MLKIPTINIPKIIEPYVGAYNFANTIKGRLATAQHNYVAFLYPLYKPTDNCYLVWSTPCKKLLFAFGPFSVGSGTNRDNVPIEKKLVVGVRLVSGSDLPDIPI